MSSVVIFGKPNCGKSLLFHRLTGVRQKVANFPGVTVQVSRGSRNGVEYADYPGVYSFKALTKDEEVAIGEFHSAVKDPKVSLILCVLDGTRLERSLVLGLQAQKIASDFKKPFLFALNMVDEVLAAGAKIDSDALAKELGSPVISISARRGSGISDLESVIQDAIKTGANFIPLRTHAEPAAQAKALNKKYGPKVDVILKGQNQLDRFFLSSIIGGISFVAIMAVLFQSIFTWASPLMDGVESIIGALSDLTTGGMADGAAKSFFADAIFGGFGSFLVFVPQIFVLTFIVGILEDSGYLARAAIICHRPLSWFGLSGKSFVPLLSGHACAIPAIMAARTIDSPKRRLLTQMVIPLTSCSARLPVYSLFIAALIPPVTFAGGLLGYQGLAFAALFGFGILVALLISGITSKTLFKSESDSPFVLELPPYRFPHWKPLIARSLSSSWKFITKAGAIIFVVTVVIWFLGYFPNGDGALESSYLATIGKFVAPVFEPIGVDWKFSVAILTSFLAREVFVGTLGTLLGIEGADENVDGLAEQLVASGFTMASGVAMLVFYAIAMQCVSTLAVMKKEMGGYRYPVIALVLYSFLAYIFAVIAYRLVI